MLPAAALPDAPPLPTDRARLDEAVARVRDGARAWALAPPREKAALARELLAGAGRTAERMVRAGCAAKGLPLDSPSAGDEWLAGVYPVLRILRQLAESLDAIAQRGRPDEPRVAAEVVVVERDEEGVGLDPGGVGGQVLAELARR